MKSTATQNELIVEAPLPLPIEPGKLKPWRRGGPLSPGSIAKFQPTGSGPLTRWIPGAKFRVDVGRDILTVVVERYMPAKFVPGSIETQRMSGGRWQTRAYLPRTVPEAVVVVVLSFQVKRYSAKRRSA